MATLTQIAGYLYNGQGSVVTQGIITMRLQQDIVSVDGTKVAPFAISVNLGSTGGYFDKSVYATVGASPAGVAYFVEYDPDPDDTSKPATQKDGYWSNYWTVPNTTTVNLGSYVSAHRGEPYANYMPLGSGGGGGGTIGGSGSTDFIAKFTATGSVGNSIIQEIGGSTIQVNGILTVASAEPILYFYESDQGVDLKRWRIDVGGGVFNIQAVNDAGSVVTGNAFNLTRAGALTLAGGLTTTTGSFSSTLHAGGNFDVGTTKFTVNATTGNATSNQELYANAGAGGVVMIGGIAADRNFGGIWIAQATPSFSNYAFLANAAGGQLLFNTANTGTADIEFRIANATRFAVGVNGANINGASNTAPTIPLTINAQDRTTTLLTLTNVGNLGVLGDVAVNTSKFTVSASTALTKVNANAAAIPAGLAGTVFQAAGADSTNTILEVAAATGLAGIFFRRANNTLASPSAIASGDAIGAVAAFGYGATAYTTSSRARIDFNASETWSDSAQGTYIGFRTTTNGTAAGVERVRIHNSGGVAIGSVTTDPGTSGLGVAGPAIFAANAGTSTYVSQLTGWRVSAAGEADFRSVYMDQLHAKSFMLDLEQASAGGRIETKGVAVLAANFTVPGAGAAVTSITRSGSTATVTTTTPHGLQSGDGAQISGAAQTEYNGLFSIVITDSTHFTYTLSGTPATPATGTIIAQGWRIMTVEDLPNAADMAVFTDGDAVVVRSFSRAAGSLTIGDAVGTAFLISTAASGTQDWYFVRTYNAPGSLAAGTVIAAKSLVLDYGTSGSGYIESTTIDGTVTVSSITRLSSTATLTTTHPHGYKNGDVVYVSGAVQTEYNGSFTITVTSTTTFTYTVSGAPVSPATGTILVDLTNGTNAPYVQIVTWASAPIAQNKTLRARLGNLRGVTGTLEYGLLAGTYLGTNGAYFRATDQNFDLHGITTKWWSGSANVAIISPNGSSPYFAIGNPAPTSFGSTAGIFLGWDNGASKAKVSFYSDANNFFQFDGTKVLVKAANFTLDSSGNITANGGTIGGWTLSSSTLTGGNVTIDSAGVIRAGATAVLTANGWYLDYNGGTPRVRVGTISAGVLAKGFYWDGSDLQIKGTNFTLDTSGNITATGGTVGGWTLASTTLTGGNVTIDSAGVVRAGATAILTANGWYLDYNSGTPRARIGTISTGALSKGLYWDGSDLQIKALNLTIDSTSVRISESTSSFDGARAYLFTGSNGDYGVYGLNKFLAAQTRTLYVNNSSSTTSLVNITYMNAASDTRQAEVELTAGGSTATGGFSRVRIRVDGGLTQIDLKNDSTIEITAPNGVTMASGDYLYPGTASGLSAFQTSYYLASHTTYGLYTNAGMGFNGDVNIATGGITASRNTASTFSASFTNTSSTGNALFLQGGQTSSHYLIYAVDYSNSYFIIRALGDGSILFGNPDGGAKGAGTLNAKAVFDDDTQLTDYMFDLYYDGHVRSEDHARWGHVQLRDIATTEAFTKAHRHLPTIPGRAEWEKNGSKSLGSMVTCLWATVEQLQLHIYELNNRLKAMGG